MALKTVLLSLALTFLMANPTTTAASRDLPTNVFPGHDLAGRLEANAGQAQCWNALLEIKSCSNEIVLFFMNGQADIGHDCCHAIDVITRNCLPAMLTSLGFTAEEGNILRGYCDSSPAPTAAAPLAAASPVPVSG